MAKRRRCSSCGFLKYEIDFLKPTWNVCKVCKNERATEWTRKRLYNITGIEYDAILALQNGVCAICKKPPKIGGKKLAVDHDHKTGLIRGLLCWSCNSFLSKANDDPVIIMNAADYIMSPPATLALGEQRFGRKGPIKKRKRKRRK